MNEPEHWLRLANRIANEQQRECPHCKEMVATAEGNSGYLFWLRLPLEASAGWHSTKTLLVVDRPRPGSFDQATKPTIAWRRGGDKRPGFDPHTCPNNV